MIELCEEAAKIESDKEQRAADAEKKEAEERVGVAILKQQAIGKKIIGENIVVAIDGAEGSSPSDATGATNASNMSTKRKPKRATKPSSYDEETNVVDLLKQFEANRSIKHDEKKQVQEDREKRKAEELDLSRKRLEIEEKRINLQEQQQQEQNNLIAQVMSGHNQLMAASIDGNPSEPTYGENC